MTASHSYSMHHRHWLTVNGIEKRAIHLKQFSVDIGTEEKPMKNTPVARNPFHSSMIVTRTNKHFFIYFIINVYIYSYTYITHNIQRRIFPVRCLSISYNVNRQRQWLSLFQAFFFSKCGFSLVFFFSIRLVYCFYHFIANYVEQSFYQIPTRFLNRKCQSYVLHATMSLYNYFHFRPSTERKKTFEVEEMWVHHHIGEVWDSFHSDLWIPLY